ncbi:hypothetical protein [Pedobacter sp. UYP30]|uniref:hypothetical protein n=1 Tax=Pedobacter sp. UYP30 TaxID=1756400 RepID=UPI003394D30F
MAKYDSLVFKQFRRLSIPWKTPRKDKPFVAPIPYMTLLPNYTAKLRVLVEVGENQPEKLEVCFNKDFFTLTIDKELPLTQGMHNLDAAITITCTNYFVKDQIVEVYAIKEIKRDLVGKLIIKANAKKFHKHLKILLVNVKIGNQRHLMNVETEKKQLLKFMRQAYIFATFETQDISLASESELQSRLKIYYPEKERAFHYLDAVLYKQRPTDYMKHRYNLNYRKIFLTPILRADNECGYTSYTTGEAEDIPNEKTFRPSVILSDVARTTKKLGMPASIGSSVMTHELCHALGLSHTFDDDSQYRFKQYSTDNLMDYYSSESKIRAIQLYKWQRERLWGLL